MVIHLKYAASFLLILMLASCSRNNSRNTIELIGMNSNLAACNSSLMASTKTFFSSLQSKAADPTTAERAIIWLAKAQEIKNISDSTDNYIVELKAALKEKAAIKINTPAEEIGEYQDAVAELFGKENKAVLLQQMLEGYCKKRLMNTDETIRAAFEKNFAEVNVTDHVKTIHDISFSGISFEEALLLLSRIQNCIRLNENSMIIFCHNMVGHTDGPMEDWVGFLVNQSTNIAKPGSKITIEAGIGMFSAAAKPNITIAGKYIPLTDNSNAVYTFKASDEKGIHHVKVLVEFTDENGLPRVIEKTVTYETAYSILH